MTEGGLYEKVLAGVAGADLPAPKPPRPSAAVVLWRRGPGGAVETFWIKRAESLPFMGGWYAFPGGGLSRRDASVPVEGMPRGAAEAPAEAGLPEAVTADVGELGPAVTPALVACAFRELFEETGVLPAALAHPGLDRLGEARRRLLAKEEDFASILAAAGLRLDADLLTYGGRWLTPPLGPLRFDNRFFLLEWPADRRLQPEALSSEAELGEWIRPADGVLRWRRGELMAAPPILYLLEVLAAEGPEAGLERLWRPTDVNLGPFRKVEFRPGLLLFPLATPTLPPAAYTNTCLLGTGDAVLVDPGSPFEREIDWLIEGLRAVRRDLGRRVTAIWLTHHHPDHVGGVEAVRRALGVPVLAHPATAKRLAGPGITVDGELADGERVELAGDPPFPVRVLHTPGHARGHLAFLEERLGSAICGDLVAGFGTIVIDPPEGSMDDYLDSLAKLRDAGPATLFPSHGPVISNPRAKLDEYIRHRLWREERIREAWHAGTRTPADMLLTVYDDVPPIAHPLAERQILAHLERLERLGQLTG